LIKNVQRDANQSLDCAFPYMSWSSVAGYFRQRRRLMPEVYLRVEFDDQGVTAIDSMGETRAVQWSHLTKIAIRTTDEGPWSADVFWAFHEAGSANPAVVIPGGCEGDSDLLTELLRRFPSLNAEQVVKAMGSTKNAYFVLWEAP
jgi:hypothetical protein